MTKTKLIAAIVAATFMFSAGANAAAVAPPVVTTSSSGAGVFGIGGCALSIIVAAADKHNRFGRQLTTEEALSCGLLYWLNLRP